MDWHLAKAKWTELRKKNGRMETKGSRTGRMSWIVTVWIDSDLMMEIRYSADCFDVCDNLEESSDPIHETQATDDARSLSGPALIGRAQWAGNRVFTCIYSSIVALIALRNGRREIEIRDLELD
jgi:hypothetical protein